MNGYSDTMG